MAAAGAAAVLFGLVLPSVPQAQSSDPPSLSLPTIAGGDEWHRLTDDTGIRILIRPIDANCARAEIAIEIDTPGLFPFLHKDMTSHLNLPIGALAIEGFCYQAPGTAYDAIPVYYLGEKIGDIRGFEINRSAQATTYFDGPFNVRPRL